MALLWVLLATTSLLFLVFYLQFRWRYRHIISAASTLPCPPKLLLFGNALSFLGSITSVSKSIIESTKQFKGLFCIWIGPVPLFVVSNPSDVQVVLNSSNFLEKDDIYKFLKPYMGNGLLTAPVPLWKRQRRLISPVLHPSNVEKFLPVFNEVSKQLIEALSRKPGVLDPKEIIFGTTMDAAMRTVIARNPLERHINKDIQYLLDTVGRLFTYRLFKIWLHIEWIFQLFHKTEVKEAMKSMANCLDMIDREWVGEKQFLDSNQEENSKSEAERTRGKNLSDVWNEYSKHNSDDHDWRYEVTTMLVGATDTVVAAISFLIFSLASNPKVQDKVYAEIQEVVGCSDRDLSLHELNSLKYLGQAIMESIRIHGTFPVILRKATKDTKLSKLTIPAGSRVMVTLHAMGWNPEYFSEPEEFRPERFSEERRKEDENERHNYAFLPFSGGPRNCLGKTYAILLIKIVMVRILRKWNVRTDLRQEDIDYELKVVMYSKTPLLMRFEPR